LRGPSSEGQSTLHHVAFRVESSTARLTFAPPSRGSSHYNSALLALAFWALAIDGLRLPKNIEQRTPPNLLHFLGASNLDPAHRAVIIKILAL
ncbi:MAG: hypothetical protein ACLQEQ_00360, partial [Nitrososphaerales archaeon]